MRPRFQVTDLCLTRCSETLRSLVRPHCEFRPMVTWMKDAYAGKHNGQTYAYSITPWKAGTLDKEIVSISVYLKASNDRIVDGKVYVVLED